MNLGSVVGDEGSEELVELRESRESQEETESIEEGGEGYGRVFLRRGTLCLASDMSLGWQVG